MENVRTNYRKAFFLHDYNVWAAAFTVVASVVLSLGYDSLGFIPLLGFTAVQAGLFWGGVAESSLWRTYVDAQERVTQRDDSRARLLNELAHYSNVNAYKRYTNQYKMMCDRIESMYTIANDTRANITATEVDRFNDMTVSYLSLLYAWLNADTTLASQRLNEAKDNITKIETRLRETSMTAIDRAHLSKALGEYRGVVERSKRRESRLTIIEASLNTIPDKLEEAYQMLSASPYSSETGQRIEESLNTLLLQEEVDSLVEAELASIGTAASIPLIRSKQAHATKQIISR